MRARFTFAMSLFAACYPEISTSRISFRGTGFDASSPVRLRKRTSNSICWLALQSAGGNL